MECSLGRALLPPVSHRLLTLNEPMLPAIVVLVNALLLATRWMTSSGAMIYPFHRHMRRPVQILGTWGSTNLNLSEDREDQIPDFDVFGGHRSNDKQRAHSEMGTRLDEHGGDGLVQSADSGPRPRGSANGPAVQDNPEDDHEGEGDVERNRDRKE